MNLAASVFKEAAFKDVIMKELALIDSMISQLRTLKSTIQKRDKISEKVRSLTPMNATPKRIQNSTADLNWTCMEVDKLRTDVARLYKGSSLDVGTEEKIYRPSPFHTYRH